MERLSGLDRRFYDALPAAARVEFARLPAHGRWAFLVRSGLWRTWLSLPPAQREASARGELYPGFDEFAAHIAWGRPARQTTVWSAGRPITVQTFIRCISGPKVGLHVDRSFECRGSSSEARLAVDRGIVTEVHYPD